MIFSLLAIYREIDSELSSQSSYSVCYIILVWFYEWYYRTRNIISDYIPFLRFAILYLSFLLIKQAQFWKWWQKTNYFLPFE